MQQATTNGTQFDTPAEINVETLVHDDKIHASLYTDPHIFEQELEKIFYRVWVFIGHDSEVPAPGDYVTRQIGRQPVLMVRDKAGAVSVFLNRCAPSWHPDLPGGVRQCPSLHLPLPRLDV